ncbi:hypothetical protein CPC08DRAFT_90493 [Agrocybe pediades]|nr:hypothetical protein CPC08DRAFT_90493 [Agrocybe pediades]
MLSRLSMVWWVHTFLILFPFFFFASYQHRHRHRTLCRTHHPPLSPQIENRELDLDFCLSLPLPLPLFLFSFLYQINQRIVSGVRASCF